MIYAVDVSNYQPADLSPYFDGWRQWGIEHVIVRLSTENPEMVDIARRQIASARAGGFSIGGYVWIYPHLAYWPQLSAAHDLATSAGAGIPVYWLDFEEQGSQAGSWSYSGITAGIDGVLKFAASVNIQPGIYTRPNWWTTYAQDTHLASMLPLWYVQVNGEVPNMDDWGSYAFGGWPGPTGKQYAFRPEADYSCFADAYLHAPPPPPEGDCAALRAKIAARLNQPGRITKRELRQIAA